MTSSAIDSLLSARQLVAEVLAAAALELFPGAILIRGQGTALCFYYDFIFPFPPSKEIFPMLEERMRQIIRLKPLLKILEMIPENGAAYLRKYKQPLRAEQAELSHFPLIQLLQMGDFVDICPTKLPEQFPGNLFFKLLEMTSLEERSVRVMGTAFFEQDRLKEALKDKSLFQKKSHLQLGRELQLFIPSKEEEGAWFFLPKGVLLQERLIEQWQKAYREKNFYFLSTPNTGNESDVLRAHIECFRAGHYSSPVRFAECSYVYSEDVGGILEGLFQTNGSLKDISHIFCLQNQLLEESISSLQLMIKISKILGFECKVVLMGAVSAHSKRIWDSHWAVLKDALKACAIDDFTEEAGSCFSGPGVELRALDVLGEEWAVSRLILDVSFLERYRLKETLLLCSAFVSFERTVALLLEKQQGVFEEIKELEN